MGTDLAQLQSILGYQFTNYDKLELALTAAGADEKNHDGNRGMAQMGEKLIGLLLAEIVYEAGGSKAEINKKTASAITKEYYENVAKTAGIAPDNDAALPSLENIDTIAIRQRDILNDELDEISPYRFATSPCLSTVETDNRALTTFESHTSHLEALQEESSQQLQERQESEIRPRDLNKPTKPTTDSSENGSSVATRSRLQIARANHETRRCRVEKPAQPHRSGQKPVQSIRRLVQRDNRHKTPSGKVSGQTEIEDEDEDEDEDKDEALTKQDISNLSAFNLQEKRKCESLGYTYVDLLASERTKCLLANSNSDKQALILRSLLVKLGGCSSLISLKNILQCYRESHQFDPPAHANICSNAQRVKMIKRLGEKAAYCLFLKYCHIHKLFVDNSRHHRNTAEVFINSNNIDITRQSSGVLGNPLNATEAQITKSMMKEVYPHIRPTHSEYNSRRREISGWRRAGRRLEQLVLRFSYGILGLFPLEKYNLNLIENIIFHLSDTRFKLLIEVLTADPSGFLENLGRAATPIVVGIFENSIDASKTFSLEDADDNEIMGCPKGSPQLLELISLAATSQE
ncbi:MAG: hypothetical protein L6R41_001018 [Letrouitia leprolyta]|nr:MAG: hypothetical protein L6R41_001018 [Letrouitia leprolyta]